MSTTPLASRDDLFAVCADRFPEPVARVASVLLFWSQLAKHQFRGRLGIYKTDADIAAEIRKHPKTAGRLVLKVCAPPASSFANALFVTAYGPKPRAQSGRVRWLFRTPLGDQLIDKALELAGARRHRKKGEHPAATRGNKSVSPATAKSSHRSPQNAAAPYLHTDNAGLRSQEYFSLTEEQKKKPDLTKEKRLQEELKRLEALWKRACTECGQVTLVWPPSEVRRWSAKLIELTEVLRLSELSDDELLKRLRLLSGNIEKLESVMGPHFTAYNRQGLMIESFARFGQKLWRAAEAELAEEEWYRKERDRLKKQN